MQLRQSISYYRNFIFGVEDSLVSTVGLLAGIAAAGADRDTVLLTGVVLIFVEAFSMSAGSFLSESAAEEYGARASPEHPTDREPIFAASIMFASYFVSGFIPLAPYIALPVGEALVYSIGLSLASLAILGAIGSSVSHRSLVRSVLRMVVIGGIAIGVGIGAGLLIGF
ncbi:MAG TPA: VIT1/CCC1 transporter family protein [Candidatus Paceibacterota bacterium]